MYQAVLKKNKKIKNGLLSNSNKLQLAAWGQHQRKNKEQYDIKIKVFSQQEERKAGLL